MVVKRSNLANQLLTPDVTRKGRGEALHNLSPPYKGTQYKGPQYKGPNIRAQESKVESKPS
ncbi:MAG TPA: hypothetical protein DD668_08710 [Alphaproteobacteria bacterium]|nr:hypothetical protein [Alphaproteobacteria bacterium]